MSPLFLFAYFNICHTVSVKGNESALELGARHAPRRAAEIVARAVGSSERRVRNFVAANRISRASIFQNSVPQVELGQAKAGLVRAQLKSEKKKQKTMFNDSIIYLQSCLITFCRALWWFRRRRGRRGWSSSRRRWSGKTANECTAWSCASRLSCWPGAVSPFRPSSATEIARPWRPRSVSKCLCCGTAWLLSSPAW